MCTIKGIFEPSKNIPFYEQVEFVKSFCYLEDRLNGESKAAMTARTRIRWKNLENVESCGLEESFR